MKFSISMICFWGIKINTVKRRISLRGPKFPWKNPSRSEFHQHQINKPGASTWRVEERQRNKHGSRNRCKCDMRTLRSNRHMGARIFSDWHLCKTNSLFMKPSALLEDRGFSWLGCFQAFHSANTVKSKQCDVLNCCLVCQAAHLQVCWSSNLVF